jgi:hypothetical protein
LIQAFNNYVAYFDSETGLDTNVFCFCTHDLRGFLEPCLDDHIGLGGREPKSKKRFRSLRPQNLPAGGPSSSRVEVARTTAFPARSAALNPTRNLAGQSVCRLRPDRHRLHARRRQWFTITRMALPVARRVEGHDRAAVCVLTLLSRRVGHRRQFVASGGFSAE